MQERPWTHSREKRQPRVLTKGKQVGHQAGQNNHNCNLLTDLARKLASRSWLWKLVPPFTAYYWVWFWHFLIEQEDELEESLMGYARRGFPFSDDQLCMLAYELTVKTHRPRFSPTKKRAGRAWRKGFMERKPWMRKKNAQNLSAARVMAVNPVQVEKFFHLLKKWVRDWK